jgi:hypothetical protein
LEYKIFGAARQPPDDFKDDLAAFCRLEEEQRSKIGLVWIEGPNDSERLTGLATLDSLNIVWNAKPMFGGDAVYFYNADSFEGAYDRMLGLVYWATMDISASDNHGNN